MISWQSIFPSDPTGQLSDPTGQLCDPTGQLSERTGLPRGFTGITVCLFSLCLAGSLLDSSSTFAQDRVADASQSAKKEPTTPGAPRLLPEDALAYVRLDNADELRTDLGDSAVGKMLADPKLKPLAGDIYGTVRDLFEQISDEVGVSLDELLSIPSGQVSMAVVPGLVPEPNDVTKDRNDDEDDESDEAIQRRLRNKRRDQNSFAAVIIIDAGKNVDKLQAIVDRLEERVTEKDGYLVRTKRVHKTDLVRWLPPRAGRTEVEYFERDGTIVLGIGHRMAEDVLDRWEGKSDAPTLADSANFTAVMARCVGAESTRPQMTFYVDPYHIAERIVKRSGSFTVGMMWPMVESLGFERIRGIGASTFHGGEVFDDISHMHILIDPPRDGLLGVLRPETGESMPPKWVPTDVSSYSSIHWDMPQTYENLGKIMDTFRGADSLQRSVEEPLKKRTGLDLQDEIVGNLTGRVIRMNWMEKPVQLNSRVSVTAVEVKDSTKANATIATQREKFPNLMTAETIGGSVVYFFKNGRNRTPRGDAFRQPEYCMFLLGKWLIQTDSRKMVERITRTNSDAISGLVSNIDYELISSELGGKLDGEKPFLVTYMRGSDFFRQMYELAASTDTRKFVRKAAENNPNAGKVADMLQRNEFPPFEEFEKYFAPSGIFAYDSPDGIHIGSFTLKGSAADDE